jgi:hypothetical protein
MMNLLRVSPNWFQWEMSTRPNIISLPSLGVQGNVVTQNGLSSAIAEAVDVEFHQAVEISERFSFNDQAGRCVVSRDRAYVASFGRARNGM